MSKVMKRHVLCGRLDCVVAQQLGEKFEELSFEEFKEVLGLVKPNVATGRDNVPGTIVRFLPESVMNQLYRAIVDRLSGREDAHVHSWAELIFVWFRRKVTFQGYATGVPISLVPTLYKVYEMCMWKVLDKELRPHPNQLVGFRARHAVLGHCFLSGGSTAES